MTAMFGGTPHSKLFLNVREKDEPLLLLRSQIQQQQGHYDCGKRRRDPEY